MVIVSAVRNLSRNPRRTLAILIIVALGVASLFIMHGFNAGIMNQYRANTIHARFGYGEVFTKNYRGQVFEKPWEHWISGYAELSGKARSVPGVTALFPRVGFSAFLSNGRSTISGRGQGVDGPAEFKFFNTLNFIEGKNLSNEIDGVALGSGMARALGVHPGDPVTVMAQSTQGLISRAELKITGIFYTGLEEFDNAVFRIPLAQAQRILDTAFIESVAFGLESDRDWDTVSRFIEDSFPDLEAVPFAVLDEVYYQHSVDWLRSQFGVIRMIILAMMTLGILTTVSTSLLERRQEIGDLRANGDSVADVIGLLSLEGLILGFLGALLGLTASLVVVDLLMPRGIYMPPAPGLTRRFWVKIELQPFMALISLSLGAGCTLLATLLAGLRVARMPIAEALRST
jgi:putative ABC transport system permease protein